jgi:hypothetical protein
VFIFTILRGRIWAGHAKKGSVGLEEGAGVEIIEVLAIVALDALDRDAKLCAYIGEKIG